MDFFFHIFDSDFMPHGHCYQWQTDILWLHVLSDGMITLAYASIPVILALFVKKRTDLAFKWLFILFAAFILLCGATHALEIWAVWHGTYRLTGIVKAMTAIVSMGTAASLLYLMPKALRLPSPRQLEEANQQLLIETAELIKARAELASREKEELFKAIVDASPNGLLLVGKDGKITLANTAAEELFHYGRNELEQCPLEDLVPHENRNNYFDLFQLYLEKSNERKMESGRELHGIAKSGERIPIEIRLSPLDWKGDTFVLAAIVDISERKAQKELLEQAHQRFDRAVQGASEGLWEWQIETNEAWMSDQLFRILRYDPSVETPSFNFWSDRIHPQDKEQALDILDRHLKHGEPYITEHRVLCGDGVYRYCLVRGATFAKEPCATTYLSGSLSIIQERKDAERELSEKSTFLDSIYRGTQHGIFVLDVTDDNTFRFAAFNPAEEMLTGIPFADAEGKQVEDLAPTYFPKEVAETVRGNYLRCVDEKMTVKYTERLPILGRETWWITHLTPLFDEQMRVYRIIGSSTDITSLKQMEQQLREKEEYATKILNNSLNGLYIFNMKLNTNIYINPAYTQITGYTKEDFANMENILALFHPDDFPMIKEHIGVVAASPMGTSQRSEYRFKHKKGHWIWCLSNDAVFSMENNKVGEIIGTFIDITQIKQYGQKLEESNQELEQFAFIASHDLREPLRKIKAFADVLITRFSEPLPEKAKDYLSRMANAAKRLDLMINDLLSFSRVSQHQLSEVVDLSEVMETVWDDLKPKISETRAQIECAKLPILEGDPNHFYQLFLNIIGNALKYSREGLAPEIHVRYEMKDSCHLITVEDNGIGLPEDKCEEIFHIFKRLHGRTEYSGSGIGLAICKKIVSRRGGQIWAESLRPNPGARFVISIPTEKSKQGGME